MARKIAVEIVGDSSSLEKAFKRSAGAAGQFNRDVGKAGKSKRLFQGAGKQVAGLTGLLGIGGLAGAAKAAFTEMGDAQKVSAQTAAVLKSTHGAAGVTADQIDKLATSLGNMSGVDDEAIASGENMLLTFTNLKNGVGKGNDVFDQTTKTMLDMSTALGQDTKTSAMQLGKALNDPIKGVGALKRVGVTFTDAQKKQIDALVKSGDTMGAQKIILHELNKEFGGSAEAAGNTLPGQLNKLKETAMNLGGAIATLLTPQIEDTIGKMVTWLQNSENQKAIMDIVKGAVEALGTGIGILKAAFELLSGAVGGNTNAIKILIGAYAAFKILTIAGKISTLADNFGLLKGKTDKATGASKNFRSSLAGKAGVAAAVFAAGWELSNLIRKIPGWDNAMKDFGATIHDVAAGLGLIKDPMKQFEGKAKPTQQLIGSLRQQAKALEARGMTPRQAADRLARQNPKVARHDIDVAAGVTARPAATMSVNTVNVYGVQDPRAFEEHMTKRARQRPHRRR